MESEDSTLSVPCPTCSALPGEPCTSFGFAVLRTGGSHGPRHALAKSVRQLDPVGRVAHGLDDTLCFREMGEEQLIFEAHDFTSYHIPMKIGGVECLRKKCVQCGLTVYVRTDQA